MAPAQQSRDSPVCQTLPSAYPHDLISSHSLSWVVIPSLQTWKVRPGSQVRENRTGPNQAVTDSLFLRQWCQRVIPGLATSALSENLLERRSFGPLTGFVGQNVRDGSGNLDFNKPSKRSQIILICVNHWSNTYFRRLLLSLLCQSREKSHPLCRGEGNRKGGACGGVSR